MVNMKSLGAIVIFTVVLTACGGGSSDATDVGHHPGDPMETGTMLYGNAATGTAMASATINIKDKKGLVRTGTTSPIGTFLVDVSGMVFPVAIKVTSADGSDVVYGFAFENAISGAAVTPISTILLTAATRQNPASAYDTYSSATATTLDNNIESVSTALYSAFAPINSALGVTLTANQMYGFFTADHTGVDRLLDAIDVSVAGTQITIRDKFGNSLGSIDASTGTTPLLTVGAGVVEGADAASGIAGYLADVSTQCRDSTSLGSYCTSLFNGSFKHATLTNPEDWLSWWNIDTDLPTATVQYRLVSVEGKDANGYLAKIALDIQRSGSTTVETEFDEGYFVNTSGTWSFIGDQEKMWLDITSDTSANEVEFTGIFQSDNPTTVGLAYVAVTAPDNTLGGEMLKIYPYAPKYPNSNGVYQVRLCQRITGNTNTSSCGNTDRPINIATEKYVRLSYQAYDASNNPIAGWAGSQWIHFK